MLRERTQLERRYHGKVVAAPDGVGHLRVRDGLVLIRWERAWAPEPVDPEALLAAGAVYEGADRRRARFFNAR
jgi:hypothetical protein